VAGRIEEYAIVGDMQSVALVSADGSADWLCLPLFDSDAFFAALLGDEHNGSWRIAPAGQATATRQYAGDTLILLSEEYDPRYGRLVGNMPQAFSHVPLIQAALNLSDHAEEHRRGSAGLGDERRIVSG
jgi:GH15 family glucan-1,4-alpha-glucosidase